MTSPLFQQRLGPGKVGALGFVLRTEDGEQLDSIAVESPLVFLFGSGALLPGLERALEGLAAGEDFKAVLRPAEAFGDYDPNLVHAVPRDQFPGDAPPPVGTQMRGTLTDGGEVEFWVTAHEADSVIVNENHPLAGVTLCFEGTVVGVRPATEDEQAGGRLLE